jgi:hypothetical protein
VRVQAPIQPVVSTKLLRCPKALRPVNERAELRQGVLSFVLFDYTTNNLISFDNGSAWPTLVSTKDGKRP